MPWIINAYRVLIGTLDGSGPPGIPGRDWKDSVKIDLKTQWNYIDCIMFMWLRTVVSGNALCEHAKDVAVTVKI
jgi:hypothetical protein